MCCWLLSGLSPGKIRAQMLTTPAWLQGAKMLLDCLKGMAGALPVQLEPLTGGTRQHFGMPHHQRAAHARAHHLTGSLHVGGGPVAPSDSPSCHLSYSRMVATSAGCSAVADILPHVSAVLPYHPPAATHHRVPTPVVAEGWGTTAGM